MHLLNIVESMEKINLYSVGCTDAETFYQINEQMNFNATLNLLANIGVNIGKLSDELKQLYPDVEWVPIKGFRNRELRLGFDMQLSFSCIFLLLPV